MKTLTELASEHGVSVQTVYNWVKRYEDARGEGSFKGQTHPTDRRKVVYSEEQVTDLLQVNGIIQNSEEVIEAEIFSPNATETVEFNGSLVPLSEAKQLSNQVFDPEIHFRQKAQHEKHSQIRAIQLNQAVTAYAQSQLAQVLAEIDATVTTIKVNALDSLGLGLGPDPNGANGSSGPSQ